MLVYVTRRIVQLIPVLLGVILVVFLIMSFVPGDPALVIAGDDATPEKVEQIRSELGLDRPLLVQYFHYLTGVIQGDFGTSYNTGLPVLSVIMERLPTTIALSISSIIITVVIGVFAGVISATKKGSFIDIFMMVIAVIGVSFPIFWIGLMLMYIFSIKFGLFPVAGWGTWKHLILPSITLGVSGAAIVARMTRSSMLDVLNQDYIRTAKSKGLKDGIVVYKHALKNALIPVITVVGLQFGVLLGGTVVTESVFAINGLGRMIVDAISKRDLPLLQGGVLIAAIIFVFVNLVIDILYKYFNKRIDLD